MDDVAGKLNLSVSQSLTVWVLRRQDTKGGGKCWVEREKKLGEKWKTEKETGERLEFSRVQYTLESNHQARPARQDQQTTYER